MNRPMMLLSGGKFDYDNFAPASFNISDIAVGLSKINRYLGQTRFPYSVAQHSVLLQEYGSECRRSSGPEDEGEFRKACLLHDAQEYVIGDMVSPVKEYLRREFQFDYDAEVERSIQEAIFEQFQVDIDYLEEVSIYDKALAANEILNLTFEKTLPPHLVEFEPWPMFTIYPWTAEQAEANFLQCYQALFKHQEGRSA